MTEPDALPEAAKLSDEQRETIWRNIAHYYTDRARREIFGERCADAASAQRCGWTASYLCDLELGRRTWGTKQVTRVALALAAR